MSGFWAQKVGVPAAPPAPPQQPVSTRPWWMPQAAPPQPQQPAQPFQQQPQYQSNLPVQQGTVAPPGEAHFGDLLTQEGYTTEKAQSAKDGESCPECDSPNYMSPKGQPNMMKQCFECGYNPRFAHSTAGASGIGQKNVAAPRPARAQTMSENNFNPKTIVGRVG